VRVALSHVIIAQVLILGALLLTLGLAVVGAFVRQPVRDLRGAKDAEALRSWQRAPDETRATIRRAWRSGIPVDDRDAALLAIEMAQHNDSVLSATNRISWWSFVPVLPGLLLLLAATHTPRVIWLFIVGPLALLLVTHPLSVRSRRRRDRSVELTKSRHSLT
jgi:hypothetical protein